MSQLDRPKTAYKKKQTTHQPKNLYNQLLITRTVPISINHIGDTIKETLRKTIASQIEGKCIVEGYIKPYSVEVITFSSGLVMGANVIFEVVIQCDVCSPVEGMTIKCIAKHINKAGIRAEINETPSPVVIFIARDHNYASPLFADVKENDDIEVRVIGQRFELNDKYISIIAEIVGGQTEQGPANAVPASLGPASLGPASLGLGPAMLTIGVASARPASLALGTATLGPATLGPATLTEPATKKPTTKKKATIKIGQSKININ
jgi:hypothetical protein